ncbi:MAG: cyclic-phosphate processing receiver domain-containing protein [Pyrinomonadaceae bacterium]
MKQKLGIATAYSGRAPIRIFLLEDDARRCEWFQKRFKGDTLDISCDIAEAKQLLESHTYDSIFLDHDLMPEHYGSDTTDDERTGYAIASFLASRPDLQRPATIMVHSFNAEGALRMVEELRSAGRQADYVPFHFLEERLKRMWPK